ncbi:globin domain-containing protein [Pseudaestuariivita atlantica]|uniref:Globin domain-containing protein n=1 Tax=Pseudaestuariivita atlantica TaxID=1317121 RepID=A0A0L1JNU6_9RHOB|nr:globin domain-containing protein [Pseudaestuariivita atlantica]KNG93078.1 hypothetical protein ATO11_14280 [Pseudaestuariivita atlantica]
MTDPIATIRRTWALAAAAPEDTARVFYSTLFRVNPESQALFRNDLDAQGDKLMETLGFIVDNLENEEALMVAARDLAIRHVAYGVKAEDYDSVGFALIATLETLLGSEFDAEARATWIEVYGTLSKAMIEAAYPA